MYIQKKDGVIQAIQMQMEEEKIYGWQSSQSLSKVDNERKTTASEYEVSSNAKAVLIQKTIKTMRNVKDEMENILQRRHKEEINFVTNKQGISSPLVLLIIGIVGMLFLCISPLLLVLSMSDSFSQTDASGIIQVAEQEESQWEFNIGGNKYKNWYGINGNWCAMFVSYCANECGYIDDGIMPKSASVASMATWYQQREQFVYKMDDFGKYYEPKAGDIIFFQNGMSHVGIVIDYDVETGKVTTIEGNTGSSSTNPYHAGSRVKRKTYPITYKKITGYGKPEYPATIL